MKRYFDPLLLCKPAPGLAAYPEPAQETVLNQGQAQKYCNPGWKSSKSGHDPGHKMNRQAPSLRRGDGWLVRFSLWLLGISLITGVHAAGIPTVDVGVIAQQIRSYQQQLRDFETQLQQVSLNSEQLTMLNRQFSQTLKEYDDYLRQVRGLHRVISRKDWNGLFQTLRNHYGISPYSRITKVQESGNAGRRAIDSEVGKLYTVPAQVDQVRRQIATVGVDPEPWVTHAQRQRTRYEAYRDQLELAKDSNRELLDRYRKIRITKNNFNLGDKSDLNALQTVVTSNFHIIDELQALNKIQNQRLLHTNHEYIQALSMAEAQRQAEAERLEKVVTAEKPLRSFRWSDLNISDR